MKILWEKIKRGWKWFVGLFVTTAVAITVVNFVAVPTPPIPDNLKLKVPFSDVLGNKPFTHFDKDETRLNKPGTGKPAVQYAYRSNKKISDLPDPEVLKEAAKNNITIVNEVISKRTKHAKTYSTDKEKVFVAEIISGVPQYYKDSLGVWWQAEYATTSLDAFNQQTAHAPLWQKIVHWFNKTAYAAACGASPCTFFPDPDAEVTSVDGDCGLSGQQTWAAKHDAADCDGVGPSNTPVNVARITSLSTCSCWTNLTRAFFLFDTSTLGAGATISAATLSLNRNGTPTNSHTQTITIYTTTPASNTDLVIGDYDQIGTTAQSDTTISFGSWAAGYNDFVLNATGRGNIDKTGVSKFGTRGSSDAANSEPSIPGGETHSYVGADMAEAADTTSDPKLVVTFTEAGGAAPKQDVIFFD